MENTKWEGNQINNLREKRNVQSENVSAGVKIKKKMHNDGDK